MGMPCFGNYFARYKFCALKTIILYTINTKNNNMGQQEVYDFLCKNKDKWFTSRDISEALSVSIGSVTMSLKKLRKTNLIKYKNTGKRNTYWYRVDSQN